MTKTAANTELSQMPAAEAGGDRSRFSHGSMTEAAAAELRRLIQVGEYAPGEHLRQDEIAERMRISRVPVREALTILTADGVVVHRPNQGYFVPKIAPAEMQEIYMMRGLLESALLAQLRWPTEEELHQIKAINNRLAEGIFQNKMDEVIKHNREFHFAIFALSNLKRVVREIQRLWDMSDGYRRALLNTPVVRQQVLDEHLAIIAALEEKNSEALVDRMADHRRSGWERLANTVGG